MSTRFHPKWHRFNHHTNPTNEFPDSSHDPIASPEYPFKGVFVIDSIPTSLSANGDIIGSTAYLESASIPLLSTQSITGENIKLTNTIVADQGNFYNIVTDQLQGINAIFTSITAQSATYLTTQELLTSIESYGDLTLATGDLTLNRGNIYVLGQGDESPTGVTYSLIITSPLICAGCLFVENEGTIPYLFTNTISGNYTDIINVQSNINLNSYNLTGQEIAAPVGRFNKIYPFNDPLVIVDPLLYSTTISSDNIYSDNVYSDNVYSNYIQTNILSATDSISAKDVFFEDGFFRGNLSIVNGNISAQYFYGDGRYLKNVVATQIAITGSFAEISGYLSVEEYISGGTFITAPLICGDNLLITNSITSPTISTDFLYVTNLDVGNIEIQGYTVSGDLTVSDNLTVGNSISSLSISADYLKVNRLDITDIEIQGYTVSGDLTVSDNLTVGNSISSPSISAGFLFADEIYALSSTIQIQNIYVTELSGFNVVGTYTGFEIPSVAPELGNNLVSLQGVGISATNYAVFDGDTAMRKLFTSPRDSSNDSLIYDQYRAQFLDGFYITNVGDRGCINLNLGSENSRYIPDSNLYQKPISAINLYYGVASDVKAVKFWSRLWDGFGNSNYPWRKDNFNNTITTPSMSGDDPVTGRNYGLGAVTMMIDCSSGNVGIGIPGIYDSLINDPTWGFGGGPGEGRPNEKLTVYGNICAADTGVIYANELNTGINSVVSSFAKTIAATGTTPIDSTSTSFNAVFYNLVISSGSNKRASTFIVTWENSNIVFTETTTIDIGSTSNISLSAAIVGSNIQLQAIITSGTWTIKGSKQVI